MNTKRQNIIRERRATRSRAKIRGTRERPRLSVFRSNRYLYLQLIDDEAGQTLLSASTHELKSHMKETKKSDEAKVAGEILAKKAKEAGIAAVALDRGRYRYHGRVKAVAEAIRAAGLKL